MFVSGPIGAIATGSGCSRRIRAISSTAPSGHGASLGAGGSSVVPIPLSPWTSVARTTAPTSGAGGALGDRDVVAAVGVEQPQRVLGAVADVGVAADGRDGQEVELRAARRRGRSPARRRGPGRCR